MIQFDVAIGLVAMALIGLRLWARDLRTQRQHHMMRRLSPWVGEMRPKDLDELEMPYWERVVVPRFRQLLLRWGKRLTPQAFHTELAQQLHAAGSPLGPEEFFLYRVVGAGIALMICGVLAVALTTMGVLPRILGVLVVTMVVFLYPGIHLKSQMQRRLAIVERGLPEVFDLLSVSVQAGLAFDGALTKVVENLNGPAQEEFGHVLADMRFGVSRAEALQALADRTRSPQLRRFASLVTQSARTGSGVGPALEIQARDIKEYRSTRAREKAAAIPIQIMFPMVLFIFPAIFIVILGPAVLSMIKVFAHGGL